MSEASQAFAEFQKAIAQLPNGPEHIAALDRHVMRTVNLHIAQGDAGKIYLQYLAFKLVAMIDSGEL